MKVNKITRRWLIILAAVLALFVVFDFEYIKFTVLDWFDLNPKSAQSLPPANGGAGLNPAFISAPSTTTPASTQAFIQKPGIAAKKYRPPEISPYTVLVESLNISAPIVYVYGTTEKEFQAGLVYGVVLYPGTALPGQAGNTYIFGHSSDYVFSKGNYKTIFANLPKIEIGAEIIISRSGGEKFSYKVFSSKKVAAKDVSVLKQDYSKKILTLQTSYPIGTALARWVVVAELVK